VANDPAERSTSSAPADRLERLVQEQLRIMRKQLDLMRAVAGADATGRPAEPSIARDPDPATPGAATAGPATAPAPHVRQVPLTDPQRDVWIVCQPGGEAAAAFDLTATLDLEGTLDTQVLQEAVRQLVQRHESLRSTIDGTGDHMLVQATARVDLPIVDLSDVPEPERTARVAAFIDAEMTHAYDLERGPLFRPTLLRLGPEQHTLVLSTHHLISDGWSLGVMQRDLSILYSGLLRGGPVELEDATPFSEFVTWRMGQSADAEPYWRSLYDRAPVQLDLPADRVRPPVRSFGYGTQRVIVGDELLPALRELAATQGVTPFIVLLAGWQLLLHRLSGQAEFASGVFVSGQASMGARSLVGLCTNLLPLRAELVDGERSPDHLARIKRGAFDAFDNQHYALGNLASALQLPRDISRPTVVSSVITLETPTRGIEFEGLRATESVHGRRRYGSFELEAYLTERDSDLIIDFKYATSIFEPATIERWLGHYVHLLQEMTTNAAAPIAELRLLDAAERREILDRWNDTQAPIPDLATHERFERQVARDPDRPAVRTSTGMLTYGELDARANRLARHLRDLGVSADRMVGVNLQRSVQMLVALLAVHKAGGAYVPLDPLFPDERLAMIASDAGLRVLITEASLVGSIPVEDASVVVLERDAALIDAQDSSGLGIAVGPSDLAYAIYTSGSTGRPKGVEIPHIALTNLLEAMRREPGLSARDALLAVTTVSFDIAGLELFLPLVTGATVVLADQTEAVDAAWLRERLGVGDITVMQATPATWQMLIDAGWTGTPDLKALCGGEALSDDLAAALGSRVGSLWNVYGPTETTIWSSVSQVLPGAPISIGHPIANTEFHVLDPSLELQPLGVPGELYIGGAGLARGYHARDDLTAERFIESRMDDGPPRRLYRTGDMVRRRADGRIEYIGRADFQVKIRGYRIELGEIETVLGRLPEVKECAVVARDGDGGVKRLVAYIVPTAERTIDVSAVRGYLRETLPEYMVPALFVVLDAFPLTANKKVDRNRLPEPDGQRPDLATELVLPRTPTEGTLAGIWQGFLGVERVGVHDNFFDLGGDSLLALRTIMRANRDGVSLPSNSIFRFQTVAELAAVADASATDGADQGIVTGPTPLTPAELRFLTERMSPDPHHWNISILLQGEALLAPALRAAVAAVVEHHDALRLRVWQDADGWRQETTPPPDSPPFETHDLTALPPADRSAEIERICTLLQGSFELDQGPLLRVAHFACGPDAPDRLLVLVHHFAVDGLTFGVLLEDLEQAYRHAVAGQRIVLPPRTTPYRDWAIQLGELAREPSTMDTAGAWLRLPWDEVMPIPTRPQADRARNTNSSAASVTLELSQGETERLLRTARPEHVILAALAHAQCRWSASPAALIDILSHGRDAALDGVNLARTVGFTLSYNPVVIRDPAWDVAARAMDAVTRQIEELPAGYSFELLRFLAPDPDLRGRLSALPKADVLFNYAAGETYVDAASTWTEAPESPGPDRSPGGLRQHAIAVRATLIPHLRLTVVYSTELHTPETIETWVAEVGATIRSILEGSAVTV
jgi:amino acid adenylation domain-containing protein